MRIEFHSSFHQVRVQKEDIAKTTFWVQHGHFEYLLILFGVTNGPAVHEFDKPRVCSIFRSVSNGVHR